MEAHEFEALIIAHQQPLLGLVQRWVWNRDDAAEIVQEAFVRLWTVRADIRSDTAAAYLRRTASNLAVSHRRRRRVRETLQHKIVDSTHASTSDEALLDAELAAALRTALDELPEPLRRVVELRDFTELGYPQIASMLAIREGTVGSRRNAALMRLRGALLAALAIAALWTWKLRPQPRPPTWAFAADHPWVAASGLGRSSRQALAPQPTHVPHVTFYRVATTDSAVQP